MNYMRVMHYRRRLQAIDRNGMNKEICAAADAVIIDLLKEITNGNGWRHEGNVQVAKYELDDFIAEFKKVKLEGYIFVPV